MATNYVINKDETVTETITTVNTLTKEQAALKLKQLIAQKESLAKNLTAKQTELQAQIDSLKK